MYNILIFTCMYIDNIVHNTCIAPVELHVYSCTAQSQLLFISVADR